MLILPLRGLDANIPPVTATTADDDGTTDDPQAGLSLESWIAHWHALAAKKPGRVKVLRNTHINIHPTYILRQAYTVTFAILLHANMCYSSPPRLSL